MCHVPLFRIPEGVLGKIIDRKRANKRRFEKFEYSREMECLSWGAVSTIPVDLARNDSSGVTNRCSKRSFVPILSIVCLEEFEIVVKIGLEIFKVKYFQTIILSIF